MSTAWPFEPSASALEQFITLIIQSETGEEKTHTQKIHTTLSESDRLTAKHTKLLLAMIVGVASVRPETAWLSEPVPSSES